MQAIPVKQSDLTKSLNENDEGYSSCEKFAAILSKMKIIKINFKLPFSRRANE